METKNKLGYALGGIIIGILLAGYGVTFMGDLFPSTPMVVTNIVPKTVTQVVEVPVPVVTERIVTKEVVKPTSKNHTWKATITDKNGNVVQYIVKKVKYTILDATITDVNGNEIVVGTNDLQVQRID